MTLPIIAIRPEPGCSATAAAARDFGLSVECHPLFELVPVPWELPEEPLDGLLVGSANAVRMGGPLVDNLVDKPVYAVGESTAAAAWERGLRTAAIGSGGLQNVVDGLAGQRLRLLRIAGEDHVPLAPPDGVEIVTVIAYRAESRPASAELAAVLQGPALVLLHSAAAARHFAAEAVRLALARETIGVAALGPRIADAAGRGWRDLRVATEPSDPALLALARDMCHEPLEGRNGRQ